MARYQPIAAEATDLPINEIILNVEWAGLVIESLTNLQSASAWDGTDSEVEHCISQIETIKDLLMGYDLIPANIAFQAQKASDQAFNSGTPALCTFTTIQNNSGGYYNTGNSRFTPLSAGRYAAWVNLGFTGTGNREIYLRKNGSVIAQAFAAYPGSNERTAHALYTEIDLDGIDDYLDVFCARSGSNITAASGAHSWWGARLVMK